MKLSQQLNQLTSNTQEKKSKKYKIYKNNIEACQILEKQRKLKKEWDEACYESYLMERDSNY